MESSLSSAHSLIVNSASFAHVSYYPDSLASSLVQDLWQQTKQVSSSVATIAFIDSNVENYQDLVTAIAPNTIAYILDPLQDAVSQITNTLLQYSGISSVHLISHGDEGRLQLGATTLTTDTLKNYDQHIQSWASVLTADADILLYGCNVAAGAMGEAFLHQLAQLTGADIAASNDWTGSAALGGDWELEVNTGEIAADLIFQASALRSYQFILPTQLVSSTGGIQGNNNSWTVSTTSNDWQQDAITSSRQSISDDGRYVLLTSGATNLTGSDTNGAEDVFLHDRSTGETILVSAQFNGTNNNSTTTGSGRSFNPVMSADGRYVAFTSEATNLVSGTDTNTASDVFLWDRETRQTTLISRNTGNSAGSGSNPSISRDGKRIVFSSFGAAILQNGDYQPQVFVYEWTTTPASGTVRQVSVNNAGQTGNEKSAFQFPALISGNGRYVVFQSEASNLIDAPGSDANGNESDIFVRDLDQNQTILVSINTNGTGSGNQKSYNPFAISDDGQTIAFISQASNLTSTPGSGRQAYVHNLTTGITQLISLSSSGEQSWPWEITQQMAISGDGRYAVFTNASANLGGSEYTDTNNARDVYLRDLMAGTTTLVSRNWQGTGAGNGASGDQQNMMPAISYDGRYVVFSSLASDLVSTDTNGERDVFLYDRTTETITLVSQNSAGTDSGNGASNFATLNRSGSVILFSSVASNLTVGDVNGRMDTFVYSRGNQSPIVANDAFGTTEDTSLFNTVLTNDRDPDNNTPLTVELVNGPTHGSLSLSSTGTFTYTPTANYSGTDTFTYSVTDSLGATSGLASVVLSVTATNDAPLATNDTYSFGTGALFSLPASGVLANDTDVDTPLANLTATVVDTSVNGSLTLNADGSFTYVPNSGFTGIDRFTYQVSDGSATSGLATVSLTITATINTPPIAVNDTTFGNEDSLLSGNVLSNDTDPNGNTPLTASVVTLPTSGSLSLNPNGSFSYSPNANFNGTDTFTYVTQDALGAGSNTATVVLTVNPVNDAPTFTIGANQTVLAGNGTQTVTGWATGFNPGAANEAGQTISNYTIVSNSNPSIFATTPSIDANGTLTYTPIASIANSATAVIEVKVQDSGGTLNGGIDLSASQFFTISVVAQPSLSISSVNQQEGNNGRTSYNFTVALSTASSQTVSVTYATNDETARVVDGDYLATSGTLTFLPGETRKVIRVDVLGDTLFETNETFRLNLTAPVNAQLATASATGTITNDDPQPVITLQAASKQEGQSVTSSLLFTVNLSAPSSQPVTVTYRTADGTATTADKDYTAANATLVFRPGETQKTVAVSVTGDRKQEQNETLTLNLQSPVGATLGISSAIGTILNDDQPTTSDFNQDGIDDVVWRNYITGENQVWLMGATLPSSIMILPSAAPGWVLEGVGDFNQDGNPDLLWREYTFGTTSFWLMNGADITSIVLLPQLPPNWIIEGVGDLDGDGQMDILWRETSGGAVVAAYMNGTEVRTYEFIYSAGVGSGWMVAGLADVNNDGRTDIIWRDRASGFTCAWGLYGTAAAPFFNVMVLPAPVGTTWNIVDTSDYNGDGKTDVLWYDYATGFNTIWLMDGDKVLGKISTQSMLWGWFGV